MKIISHKAVSERQTRNLLNKTIRLSIEEKLKKVFLDSVTNKYFVI